MNPVISFLRSIRKQQRATRVLFFWTVVIVVVPLALYVWSVSFYQTLQRVTVSQQIPESSQETFGRQAAARFAQMLDQARQGLMYVQHAVGSGFSNLHIGDWIAERFRVLRGVPDVQPALPDHSPVLLPVAGQAASTTPAIASPNW